MAPAPPCLYILARGSASLPLPSSAPPRISTLVDCRQSSASPGMDELLQNALKHWDTHRMGQRCGDAGITHMKVETAGQSRLDLWAIWEIP